MSSDELRRVQMSSDEYRLVQMISDELEEFLHHFSDSVLNLVKRAVVHEGGAGAV
jgi:hypothetical protein